MDVFIPTQQIIKFYQLAPRIQNIKKQKVTDQIVSKHLIQLWSQLSSEKIEQTQQLVIAAIKLYAPDSKIYDLADVLAGNKSFEFYPIVMAIATKQNLKICSENMLTKQDNVVEQLPKSLKNISVASQSFVPAIIQALLTSNQKTTLFSDHNLAFDGVTSNNHFFVQPLKANPRNYLEEAAAYILVDDSIDLIQKKVNKGFCEDKNVEVNPVLDQFKIIFCFQESVKINDKTYTTVEQIAADFKEGAIVPKSLKEAVVEGFKTFWIENEQVKSLGESLKKK
ncbi:Conserved_hypothetical protein [Hexamita inflata]|uniref:tyrosine--tRNA ligase n=1 Tax=Hexamita inflata TaxID=28002 RepID=A0AA86UTD6_9EUKA|nr:Conserved hypothetical protein [Hexamita inflata]